jgi:hypothetical protein
MHLLLARADGVHASALLQSSPLLPRDDRLDLSASGKSRSDPARVRMRGNSRNRGRHSIDLGRDLKKHMASQTIDENVSA